MTTTHTEWRSQDDVPTYQPPTGGAPRAVIVDIDGTLARRIEPGRHWTDWARVNEDTPVNAVITTVRALHAAGHKILVLSGRPAVCRAATEAWLAEHLDFPYEKLLMRPDRDFRPDWAMKALLFDEHIRHQYAVQLVLDDRDQVVTLWRAIGLPCFQVAPGDF